MNATDILMNSVYGIGGSGGGSPSLQSKTATPTKQSQTVQPDSGYDGLSQVTVEAIPARYPDVSGDTAVESDVAQGKTFHKADGTQATGTASGGGGDDTDMEHVLMRSGSDGQYRVTSSLNSIGDYAFQHNSKIAELIAPNVKSIGAYAFSDCPYLTNCSALAAGNVHTIGGNAFSGCSRFAPDRIAMKPLYSWIKAQIAANAFSGCGSQVSDWKLKIIALGDVYIFGESFFGCSTLKEVCIEGSGSVSMASTCFSNCANLTDIYVPWSSGAVADAPWGATNAAIHYDTTYDENGNPIV